MPELREVFEMTTRQVEPDKDAWREQEKHQRRSSRNKKLGAFAVAAVLVASLTAYGAVQFSRSEPTPANQPSPSVAINPTPPIGAQLIGLDGTVVGQIPSVPEFSEAPEISPDGQLIAFYSPTGALDIVGIDGTGERELVSRDTFMLGDAKYAISWSPDGSQLAFTRRENIWIVNADGSNLHALTQSGPATGNYHPAWSPDGSTIAYWHGSIDSPDGGPDDAEIYTIPAGGGRPTRLTHDDAGSIEPAWSPDGKLIVYRTAPPDDLIVMQADGSDSHRMTPDWMNPWAPAWSPDGSRIAFLNFRPTSPRADSLCGLPVPQGCEPLAPLLDVDVLDVATGRVTKLDVQVATDNNRPSWASDDVLLVYRYR
jgi:Tol biopolymer transport system component